MLIALRYDAGHGIMRDVHWSEISHISTTEIVHSPTKHILVQGQTDNKVIQWLPKGITG